MGPLLLVAMVAQFAAGLGLIAAALLVGCGSANRLYRSAVGSGWDSVVHAGLDRLVRRAGRDPHCGHADPTCLPAAGVSCRRVDLRRAKATACGNPLALSPGRNAHLGSAARHRSDHRSRLLEQLHRQCVAGDIPTVARADAGWRLDCSLSCRWIDACRRQPLASSYGDPYRPSLDVAGDCSSKCAWCLACGTRDCPRGNSSGKSK